MRMTAFFSCLSLIALLACGSPQDEGSELDWAHSTVSRATGTIPALVAFKELGFRTDFQSLRVCLQESPSYRGRNLLLEAKLAYAAWMDASGRGTANNWKLFNFSIKAHCDLNDKNFASTVIIASREKHDPSQADDFTVVNCSQRSCYPNGYTTGWGGPAALSYSYVGNSPNIWTDVSMSMPSVARLSPYLYWESLETEFKLVLKDKEADSSRSNLSAGQVQSLLSEYLSLKSEAETVSYAELVAFNKKLATLKVDSKARYSIINARPGNNGSSYQLQTPGFHTLLHEVGHQFGMLHAHVKQGYTDNGAVSGSGAKQKAGYWVTDAATMAYNNSYFYLSADDKAGIQDLSRKLYPYLSARRGSRG